MTDLLVALAYSRGISFFDYSMKMCIEQINATASECITCEVILNALPGPGNYSIDFLKSVTRIGWQRGMDYRKLRSLCPNAMIVFEDLLTRDSSDDIQLRIEPFSVMAIVNDVIIDLNQIDIEDSLEIVKFCKTFPYKGNEVTAIQRYMRIMYE